jgi:hypothetical protein
MKRTVWILISGGRRVFDGLCKMRMGAMMGVVWLWGCGFITNGLRLELSRWRRKEVEELCLLLF